MGQVEWWCQEEKAFHWVEQWTCGSDGYSWTYGPREAWKCWQLAPTPLLSVYVIVIGQASSYMLCSNHLQLPSDILNTPWPMNAYLGLVSRYTIHNIYLRRVRVEIAQRITKCWNHLSSLARSDTEIQQHRDKCRYDVEWHCMLTSFTVIDEWHY